MIVDRHEKALLKKMLRKRYIGNKQMLEENAAKGFPVGEAKEVRRAVKGLIRDGFLLYKKKKEGARISLDPTKLKELKKLLLE
ncbi:MAG: hypothetical protein KAW41_03370 [Candidatus Diapherotrites archaeon]|nr:hypothetical protein [Candidatus Diapherotrites archaeon]